MENISGVPKVRKNKTKKSSKSPFIIVYTFKKGSPGGRWHRPYT